MKWDRQAVSGYIRKAILNGHERERILNCYQKELILCHALATERTAATGKIICVSSSLVIQQARGFLAFDGLTRRQRVFNQHCRKLRLPDGIMPGEAARIAQQSLDPVEPAEVRSRSRQPSRHNSALNATCTLFSLGPYKAVLKKDATERQVVRSGHVFGWIIPITAILVALLLTQTESFLLTCRR